MKIKNRLAIFGILIITLIISACAEEPDKGQDANMPNPASVYCEDQGGQLEMRENEAGQFGVCIFPDSSECDEWAYFRGECAPGGITDDEGSNFEPFSMQVVAIYGSVISSGTDLPATSKLVLTPEGFGSVFVTGETSAIEELILSIRDKEMPSNKANFWGQLDCPSMGECLLTVSQMREDGPGAFPPADLVEGWEGVIYNGPAGPRSGGDDYFALIGAMPFQYGIEGADDTVRQQLESLRDTQQVVRIWGEIFAGRMDWNGAQIIVSKIELIDADLTLIPDAPNW